MSRGERSSADHLRKGVSSLAGRRKTYIPVELEETKRASAHHEPPHLPSHGPLFRIGQTVSLSLGTLGRGKSISGKIVKILPL
ncbi:MAG TPA: hypothetical protein VKB53_12440, partial [Gammaproteobacteria bacterium]|nr:hypothetical protein [Gammaproteobacteria bacterium]